MQIDLYIDTICPWCYIGLKRLEKALSKRSELKPDIRYKSFLLNPNIPLAGINKKQYILEKFKSEEYHQKITSIIEKTAISENINLNLDAIETIPNSIYSHCLIRLAESFGNQHQVVSILFDSYFRLGLNISQKETLIKIGKEVNLNKKDILEFIEDPKNTLSLKKETSHLRRLGITGVPSFIINNKLAISGAQEKEVLIKMLDLASTEDDRQLFQFIG